MIVNNSQILKFETKNYESSLNSNTVITTFYDLETKENKTYHYATIPITL